MTIFPLLADEEEQLVLFGIPFLGNEYGTAKSVAEIIETQWVDLLGKERARVKPVIADEFK
jgi:hypothetical protein